MTILKTKLFTLILTSLIILFACGQNKQTPSTINFNQKSKIMTDAKNTIDTATFGAGCFWCVEAVFQRLNGVISVKSGYSGGTIKNPSYKEVCTGTTGHAEVCQLTFDNSKISFDELLEVFWKTHDPTTLNAQGNDIGTQYRSVIFYHNENQKNISQKYKDEINKSGAYPNPIVTEITEFTNFYPAEDYHANYYNLNGQEGYCKMVIQTKVKKFEEIFKSKLK